jgi:2-keto-4-pentenoate hydratase/2-oxohepta-3-ene-1,7-dioic acid hydratase in catechol pathway
MHLVTLSVAGRAAPGILIGEEILDLGAAAGVLPAAGLVPASMRGLLEGGDAALELVRSIRRQVLEDEGSLSTQLRDRGALVSAADVTLLAPVPDPGVILGAGLNYRAHLKEMKDTPVPDRPASLYKSPAAVIGPGAAIVPPQEWADMVDWEGEFSAVFGRACHRVKASEALDYIAGYTLINDVSARNWVPGVFSAKGVFGPIHAWEHNILGKQFPTFCPMGPTLATRDEIADPGKVNITTTLNGKVMQSACTDDLIFGLRELIEYYSQFYRFRPGDIISTGTPSGVGYGRSPQVFMQPGDVVAIAVKEIGTLSNPVAAA